MFESFFLACTLMGLGIGIDVAIATGMRSSQLRQQKTALLWVVGVTATHTVFPMLGYLLTYFSIQSLPVLTPIIGLVATALIARFLWDELMTEPHQDSGSHQLMVSLGIILAVSWDALWSGPAKSAQVVGWSEWLIWLSFLLVGFVVMGFAVMAYRLGLLVCQSRFSSGKIITVMQWLQYSVIAYFGLLALTRYTLGSEASALLIFMISALAILMLMNVDKVKLAQTSQ